MTGTLFFWLGFALATPSEEDQQRQREAEREEALFGVPPAATDAAPRTRSSTVADASVASGEAGVEGPLRSRPLDDESRLVARVPGGGLVEQLQTKIAGRDRIATLGGSLLLQLQYSALEGIDPGEAPLRAPSFLSLFVDVRPSDRVRLFAEGRVQTDFTLRTDDNVVDGGRLAAANLAGFVSDDTEAVLDQLWLKFDAARRVFFTVGKQRLRWGSGRFFNPTDFVNRQRQNPLAIFDQRLGLGLIKVHVPFEKSGGNLYAIVDLEEADQPERIGAALRGEFLLGPSETALVASYRKGTGVRWGADATFGVWQMDFRTELAFAYDDETPFYEGNFDLSVPELPTRVDRSDEVRFEAMLGADLNLKLSEDGDLLVLGAEYSYFGSGYSSADLYPFLIIAPPLSETGAFPGDPIPPLFNPFRIGLHYLAAYATLVAPFSWKSTTFVATAITNLSDRSAILRFDYAQGILTFLTLRFFVNGYVGQLGAFKLGFEIPPFEAPPDAPDEVEQVSQGVIVAAPIVDVGLALSMTF